MTTAYGDIRVENREGVGVLVMDRGDGRNAMRPQTAREIAQAMTAFSHEPSVKAVVLAAEGKHFSAGADFAFLNELKKAAPMEIRNQVYEAFQGAARSIWNCHKPTVAAVNGAAITVGCEFSLACDFRLADTTALFQESWIRLGLMPPLGGLYLLPRIVGLGRAAEMTLTGRQVAAEEALAWGLVSKVADPSALRDEAVAMARDLAALPPQAYRAVKEGLHRGLASDMEREWQANVAHQAVLISSEDHKEGVAAAMERRAGVYAGR